MTYNKKEKNMTVTIAFLALLGSIGLAFQINQLQGYEAILDVSSALLMALLGAGVLTRFRPESTIRKAATKTLWSTAWGVLFGWWILEHTNISARSSRALVYGSCGAFALIFIQSFVIAVEQQIPRLTNASVSWLMLKAFVILGLSDKAREVQQAQYQRKVIAKHKEVVAQRLESEKAED